MRVLITGGAGYVGYSLVSQLLKNEENLHAITIYDNLSRKNYSFFTEGKFDQKPVRFYDADILDGRKLQKVMAEHDCVVHLAAKVTTPFADREAHAFDQINHWGTAQVVLAAEETDIQHVIYLSSISVYGSSDTLHNEHSTVAPQSFYGISKWNGEKQMAYLAEKKNVTILRSGNVYGYNPSYRIDAVINKFMFNSHFNNKVVIHGNGDQARPFIHVDKLAHVLHKVIDQVVEPDIYNVVEHNMTVNQVKDAIKKLYPNLDAIYVSSNIKMWDIRVETPCKIFQKIPLPDRSFQDELQHFKEQFSFPSWQN